MVCPLCPSAGFLGGVIGGYFGIKSPHSFGGRCLSILTTASLVSLTVIALKKMFNISPCYGMGFTPASIAVVVVQTLVLGIVYSIGVNYLLNRFVFNQPQQQQLQPENHHECCCH